MTHPCQRCTNPETVYHACDHRGCAVSCLCFTCNLYADFDRVYNCPNCLSASYCARHWLEGGSGARPCGICQRRIRPLHDMGDLARYLGYKKLARQQQAIRESSKKKRRSAPVMMSRVKDAH